MRIEYENKFRDLVMFHAIHHFMSPAVQIFYVAIAIFLVKFTEEKGGLLFHIVYAVIIYTFLWAVQFVFNFFYLISRENRTFLTTHIIEIRKDGIFEETKFNQTLNLWPGIIKVVDRAGFVAIYSSQNTAHIIPKRAFDSNLYREKFIHIVREGLVGV